MYMSLKIPSRVTLKTQNLWIWVISRDCDILNTPDESRASSSRATQGFLLVHIYQTAQLSQLSRKIDQEIISHQKGRGFISAPLVSQNKIKNFTSVGVYKEVKTYQVM